MSENPNLVKQTIGVFYQPATIFRTINEDHLTRGIIIILMTTILAAISSTIYMSKIPLTVLAPELVETMDLPQMGGTLNLIAGATAGVTVLIGWAITTLIIHTLGKLTGDEGSLRRLFAINGIAAAPLLVNQVLRTIDAQLIDPSALIGYFMAYRETSNTLLRALIGSNLMNIWTLATITLYTHGAMENYNLQRGRALLIASTPSILALILNYVTG